MPKFKIVDHFHKEGPDHEDREMINLITIKGREMLDLVETIDEMNRCQMAKALAGKEKGHEMAAYDVERLLVANPVLWTSQAKMDFQLGIMKLLRAINQPTDL